MCVPIPKDLMTLTEAAREIPGRKPGHPLGVNTLHRWCSRGVRGVKLRSILFGGHRMTTRAWLAEFLAQINAEPASGPAGADGANAEAKLIQMGA
jgi:hypothetical protein